MNKLYVFSLLAVSMLACNQKKEQKEAKKYEEKYHARWDNRALNFKGLDTLDLHETYLSIYSEVYTYSESRKLDIAATISIRNTSASDSIFLVSSKYYDTQGNLIREYNNKPVFVLPMETIEIVIDKNDVVGGGGTNFLFGWKSRNPKVEPIFEGIMVSAQGQLGLSFVTHGKHLK